MALHHPIRAITRTLWAALCLVGLLGWTPPQPTLDAQGSGPSFRFEGLSDSAPTAAIALGDLNGDGSLDIFVGNQTSPDPEADPEQKQNYVYLNPSRNLETDTWTSKAVGGIEDTHSVALGDLNGDGRLDVVAGNYDQPSQVYLNSGAGRLSPFSYSNEPVIELAITSASAPT